MPRVIIIEDETLAALRLENMIRQCDESLEVVAKLPSIKAAVQWLKTQPQPDLIFMDIHLEDGSSFSIFEQTDVEAPVIFTTAYDAYTLQAFKVNSIDYLLKPINANELAFAIEQFRKLKLSSYHFQNQDTASIENLKKTTVKSRFLVTSGSKIISIPVEEIAYFYSEDKITFLHTTANSRYPIDYSLDKLMPLLHSDCFFRINRKFIISMGAIEGIFKISTNRLKINLQPTYNEPVYVSFDKYSTFKNWLDN